MRITLRVARRDSFLRDLREATTYTQRRQMNAKLSSIFRKAKVSMQGRAWTDAQAAYVRGGEQAARKLVAKLAK